MRSIFGRTGRVSMPVCLIALVLSLVSFPASAEGIAGKKAKAPEGAAGHQKIQAKAAPGPDEVRDLRLPEIEGEEMFDAERGMTAVGEAAKRRAELHLGRPTVQPRKSSLTDTILRLPVRHPHGLIPIINAPVFGGSFTVFSTSSIPPDSALAVGPYNMVASINGSVRILKKNGTVISTQGLGSFFGSSIKIFDPKAMWDEYLQRFWVLAVTVNPSPPTDSSSLTSQMVIALSNDDDATHGFNTFTLDAMVNGSEDTENWCDYPQLGMDANQIYVTCNMFTFDDKDFQTSKVRILTKSQFVNNTCCSWYDFWDLYDVVRHSFTVQPAVMHGAGSSTPMFLVNAHGQGGDDAELSLWRIRDAWRCCGEPGDPILDGENFDVGAYWTAASARQPGTSTGIDSGDTRLLYAVWRNGRLSMGQTTACSDDDNADVCTAYTELDLNNGIDSDNVTNLSDFYFGSAGADYYYPSAETNSAEKKAMVYSRSSSSEFATTAFIGIPASSSCTNCVDTPETTLLSGLSTYVSTGGTTRNRWGDYLSASVDPDGTGVWVHGQASVTMTTSATPAGLVFENMDTTAPVTASLVDPTPNAAGWNNTNAFLDLDASDAGSGVRFLTYSATGAHPVATTQISSHVAFLYDNSEGTTTYSFFAEDFWGNVETTKTKTLRIDKSNPVVVCGSPDGLWHANNISISCTASDAGPSGLANPGADSFFTLTTSVAAGTETANASTNTHQVCDVAGNCVTAGPIAGNKIDRKAPTITISTPAGLPVYLLHQLVAASYGCADGGSGVTVCSGNVPNGSNLDTSSVGLKTFTVNATDQVGNTSSASAQYYVTYNVCLQYDPTKEHAINSSITIRLVLCDVNGVTVSDPTLVLTALSVTPPGVLQNVGSSNPGNLFIQSAVGDYQYQLSLKNFVSGDYALVFSVNGDPVSHSAPFKVK